MKEKVLTTHAVIFKGDEHEDGVFAKTPHSTITVRKDAADGKWVIDFGQGVSYNVKSLYNHCRVSRPKRLYLDFGQRIFIRTVELDSYLERALAFITKHI